MQFELSIINGKTVFDIVRAHRSECIQIVREAYLAHAEGQSVNPDSYFLKFPDKPDCRIIALPAYLGKNFDVAGLKWIASYPANVQRGFPRASAVLAWNRGHRVHRPVRLRVPGRHGMDDRGSTLTRPVASRE